MRGRSDPNTAKTFFLRVGQLLATNSIDLHSPVIAQKLKGLALSGINDHRLRIEVVQIKLSDQFGLRLAAAPLKKPGVCVACVRAGHDQRLALPDPDSTNA